MVEISGNLKRKTQKSTKGKFISAQKLVKSNSVKKYLVNESVRWVVVGNRKEYLVFDSPPWCGCENFSRYLQQSSEKCKHILAVEIAKEENSYDTFSLEKQEYDFIRPDFINY